MKPGLVLPQDEAQRLEALRRYDILDTPPDGSFDRITALAAHILDVPIALVSLVDHDRIWFKSRHGLDVSQIDRDPGLCASAILEDAPYLVADARKDPRTLANPLVASEFGLRFYVATPLTTHDGYKLGTLCCIDREPRQVTAKQTKMLEHLAGIVIDEMELRLAARRQEAMHADLQEISATAHAAVKAKTTFLATMSHEIRTPMNAVIGMTSILLDSELTEDQKEHALIIRESGEHLLGIIDDILDYSKIEAGKLDLEEHDFSLHDCLEGSLNLIEVQADERELEVELRIADDMPDRVRGDMGRLRQILLNLLSNAVKFSKPGGQIIVEACVRADQFDCVDLEIQVTDSGIGIPRELQTALFEPFEQIRSHSHQQAKGTGLGLAISRRLVESMGGQIGVESEAGAGATFSFNVVLRKQSERRHSVRKWLNAALKSQPTESGEFDSSMGDRRPLRIIIAEDNPVNRTVARLMLNKLGYRPDLVNDGQELLQAIGRQTYDLALIDIRMPVMDGIQATRELIRKYPGAGRPRLVAMTANAMAEDRQSAIDAGLDGYITKPISLHALVAELNQTPRKAGLRSRAIRRVQNKVFGKR